MSGERVWGEVREKEWGEEGKAGGAAAMDMCAASNAKAGPA